VSEHDGRENEPTPAELRELASTLTELAELIDATYQRLIAAAREDTRRAGLRLPEATDQLRQAAGGVEAAAGNLMRIRTARDDRLCGIPWGVCPDHGNTLTSSGGQSWCRTCGRRWHYDRAGLPCTEPVTHVLTDAEGGQLRMCTGHALDAGHRVVDGRVDAL
jgi:hypothetical protein